MQLAWKHKARKSSLFLNSINLRKHASHHKTKVASLKVKVCSFSVNNNYQHACNEWIYINFKTSLYSRFRTFFFSYLVCPIDIGLMSKKFKVHHFKLNGGNPYLNLIFWSPSLSKNQNVLNIFQVNVLNHHTLKPSISFILYPCV